MMVIMPTNGGSSRTRIEGFLNLARVSHVKTDNRLTLSEAVLIVDTPLKNTISSYLHLSFLIFHTSLVKCTCERSS